MQAGKIKIKTNKPVDRRNNFSSNSDREKDQDNDHVKSNIRQLAEKALDPDLLQVETLGEEITEAVVQYLKDKACSFRWQETVKSIDYAQAIVHIGEKRKNKRQHALGLMTLGDSMAVSGDQLESAWKIQLQGSALFIEAGDELGWARSVIGRIGICLEMNRCNETLKEAEKALDIFHKHKRDDLILKLSINMAKIYNTLGEYAKTIEIFHSILSSTQEIDEHNRVYLSILYNNVGNAYLFLGEYNYAYDLFESSKSLLIVLKKTDAVNIVIQNIAYIEQARGNYSHALYLLNKIMEGSDGSKSVNSIRVKIDLAECNLYLNRYEKARQLATTIIRDLTISAQAFGMDLGHAYRCAALADMGKEKYQEAAENLKLAEKIFSSSGSETWTWYIRLLQSKLSFEQQDYVDSLKKSGAAAAFFSKRKQYSNYCRALLLNAYSLFQLREFQEAIRLARVAYKIAKMYQIREILFNILILQSGIHEARGKIRKSLSSLRRAFNIVERWQHSLTITLRPTFFDNKDELLHRFINLELNRKKTVKALRVLERFKFLASFGYLINRPRLYWLKEDQESQFLIKRLRNLRAQHHCLYQLFSDFAISRNEGSKLNQDELKHKLRSNEQSIHATIEKLYLRTAEEQRYFLARPPELRRVQSHLTSEELILEYYYNQYGFYAFVIGKDRIVCEKLSGSAAEIQLLLDKYFFNSRCALTHTQPPASHANLVRINKRISETLYKILLLPFKTWMGRVKRLYIVPYGILHYLPFNGLFDGRHYLIERYELVNLPSSAMVLWQGPETNPGSVIIAHSNNGLLPGTLREAAEVRKILNGKLYKEQEAVHTCLDQEPVEVLHIATHGEHRVDDPDLSHIQLQEGQLFAHDFLQKNMAYQLVTLSACETGRNMVHKGEELIGLLRGVLYAGAGAVVLSLWRVDDFHTIYLMKRFYQQLEQGDSKAASLKEAQCSILREEKELHPAFWGAFQLIGDASPIKKNSNLGGRK